PLSLIYAAAVYLRNLSYDLGWRSSSTFNTPTICVGNLSLGGTGKTPMIEWLIRNISNYQRIAVLSRGYRRKTVGFVLADSQSTAEDIGDEPLQIYSKFPSVTMVSDGNRRRGISVLENQFDPELILLDDAFQHRKVIPRYSILLTTFNRLYTEDWFLPTGNLRDSKSQAKRANLIVVTKCPGDLSDESMADIRSRLKPKAHQEVLFCTIEYSALIQGRAGSRQLDELKSSAVTVATGIADPDPFLKFLSQQGIELNHIKFRDHHHFSASDLDLLRKEPLVLTTEKDYVRGLNVLDQAYFLEVRHRFLSDGKQQLLNALKNL
ncbi:MAG: tetraacyldisaccharide 4'-kinase, partial [Flavobacteriaceae bacterium]